MFSGRACPLRQLRGQPARYNNPWPFFLFLSPPRGRAGGLPLKLPGFFVYKLAAGIGFQPRALGRVALQCRVPSCCRLSWSPLPKPHAARLLLAINHQTACHAMVLAGRRAQCVRGTGPRHAELTFPYKAVITDRQHLCSSERPRGDQRHPTDRLKAGQQVEVYQHAPGYGTPSGRPAGNFSWVAGRDLEVNKDNLALWPRRSTWCRGWAAVSSDIREGDPGAAETRRGGRGAGDEAERSGRARAGA